MHQNIGFLVFFFVRREVKISKWLDRPDDLLAAWPLIRAPGMSNPVSSKGKRLTFPTKTLEMSRENILFVGDFPCFFN